MDDKANDLKDLSSAIMHTYHDEINKYLSSKPAGSLTDADVIIMIGNIVMTVSTSIYYSLRSLLPTTVIDYDFMKAKICNSLSDSFEGIKKYNPKDTMLPLTVDQVADIQKNGFTMITMPDGSKRRINESEVLVKKEDAYRMAESVKKEMAGAEKLSPRIIIPPPGSFQRRK